MQKKKRSQWRKLDNAAQAFPAATGKKDTRVFRLYCELKEDVIEEVLQKAVECTLEKYPLYCSVLYGAAEFKTKSQGRRSAALQRTVCA